MPLLQEKKRQNNTSTRATPASPDSRVHGEIGFLVAAAAPPPLPPRLPPPPPVVRNTSAAPPPLPHRHCSPSAPPPLPRSLTDAAPPLHLQQGYIPAPSTVVPAPAGAQKLHRLRTPHPEHQIRRARPVTMLLKASSVHWQFRRGASICWWPAVLLTFNLNVASIFSMLLGCRC
jgi:hypothetical protein